MAKDKWVDPEENTLDGMLRVMANLDHCCTNCANLYENQYSCKAFPVQIPAPLLTGGRSHTKPYPGDNGIRWTKKEK